jgi:hypothetical protein
MLFPTPDAPLTLEWPFCNSCRVLPGEPLHAARHAPRSTEAVITRLASSITVIVGVLALGAVADAQNTCDAGKLKCVAKKKACLMKVEGRALWQGLPVDAAKRQRCLDKFDGGLDPSRGCIGKLESKQNPAKPGTLCTLTDDAASLEAAVDAFVDDVLADVALDYPAVEPPNKCHAAVAKCVAKRCACTLKVRTQAIKKGAPVDLGKIIKCRNQFFKQSVSEPQGCLDKVYGKQHPSKPETLCEVPDDGGSLAAKVDAFVDDIVAAMFCGDGVIQAGEECDGGDLGGETCNSQGHTGSGLACTASCTLDVGACGPTCAAGTKAAGPACWRLATAQDCDGACGAVGQTCDAATMNAFGGAAGTDGECTLILEAVGQIVLGQTSAAANLGCFYDPSISVGYRGTLPTDCSTSVAPPIFRACACQ